MGASRRIGTLASGAGGLALLAHYLPSVCVLGQWSPVPLGALPRGWCRWSVPGGSERVGLTFDDGPSPESTPLTLDLLDELGMRATFFVLGRLAEAHPQLVHETLRRGHGVGSHGYDHEHHLLRSPAWIKGDVARSVEVLEHLCRRPRWYRPTYGQLTARTILEARRHQMEVVLWSAWGREWAESDPSAVMRRLEVHLRPGAIILLHDTDVMCPPGTAARTHATLELLAAKLKDLGLSAVSLDEVVDVDA